MTGSVIDQLQWATTLSRRDLAKKFNDCMSALNNRSHRGKRDGSQKLLRPINGMLEMETYVDARFARCVTMAQMGSIRGQTLIAIPVFNWSPKTINRVKSDMCEAKLNAARQTSNKLVYCEALIDWNGRARASNTSEILLRA